MQTLAVISCADSGELHTLALDAAGRLHTAQVLDLGGSLMPMVQHPFLPRLYVSRRSDPLAVLTLSIGADGRLALLAEAPLPASAPYVSVDRTGRWLMAASYGGNCISIGPIDAQGLPGPASAVLPTRPSAHCIVPDPANRFVYVASLGGDCVHRYRLDATQGILAPTEPATIAMAPGCGPRHLVFNAGGTRVYLLNELDASLDVLACDPATGDLQPLQRVSLMPEGAPGEPWAAEVRLSADGRWLLATERRTSTLTAWAVDAQGRLTLRDRQPVEAQPRGMQVSPDGRHVLVAGQASHQVASLALDPASGALTPCDRIAVGLNPNWIEFLRLPG